MEEEKALPEPKISKWDELGEVIGSM